VHSHRRTEPRSATCRKKIRYRLRVWFRRYLADRQTYSSQYFATAAAVKVMFNAYGTTMLNTFRQRLKTRFFRQRQTSSDDAVTFLWLWSRQTSVKTFTYLLLANSDARQRLRSLASSPLIIISFCSILECLRCFDTVGLASGRASGLYKVEWWGFLSTGRFKWFACDPTDATATPSSLASLKSRLV